MSLAHIRHWVFDLDNTLYPPSARLFDEIEERMEAYIMRSLQVDEAAAKSLRASFWKSHGTTLAGLMDEYSIDPVAFLDDVHQIDLSAIEADPHLMRTITALTGQRVIYTNGSRKHGERVSRARGVRGAFHGIFGIEDASYRPKPRREAFEQVFALAGVEPGAAVMFEDDPRNLQAPHDMGMVTVLVGEAPDAPHIHHRTTDLAAFLAQISTCGFPPR